ncbi:MAG: UPF0149 family protein [Gammaproteobacteria bacterium]|nr:UPF0149 family protein [Gammaproteobacteria bacterium]
MSELALAASATTMDLSPAELHGTVCGIQCAKARRRLIGADEGYHAADEDSSVEEDSDGFFPLEAYLALVGTEAVQDADALLNFAHLTADELFADDFRFAPLLPDDEEPIEDRVAALSDWCSGFLAGLAALGEMEPGEAEEEIIEDLSAIASAEAGSDDPEELERYYTEIVEYLKVTILTLLHADGSDAQ